MSSFFQTLYQKCVSWPFTRHLKQLGKLQMENFVPIFLIIPNKAIKKKTQRGYRYCDTNDKLLHRIPEFGIFIILRNEREESKT